MESRVDVIKDAVFKSLYYLNIGRKWICVHVSVELLCRIWIMSLSTLPALQEIHFNNSFSRLYSFLQKWLSGSKLHSMLG